MPEAEAVVVRVWRVGEPIEPSLVEMVGEDDGEGEEDEQLDLELDLVGIEGVIAIANVMDMFIVVVPQR